MKKCKMLLIFLLSYALLGGVEGFVGLGSVNAGLSGLEQAAVNTTTTAKKKKNKKATADPTDGWSKYARNGDFMSSKLKSNRKFGYGMFVCKMQAALGPVCSTFWLFSDGPAPGCMPEVRQMWRWNEFDWEFVPYTQTNQNSYITLSESSFSGMTKTYYGSAFTPLNTWSDGQITPDKIVWVKDRIMTDNIMFADMQNYYNYWMVDRNNATMKIAASDIGYQGAANTTGPNHKVGGLTTDPNGLPGWHQGTEWKYPATAVKPFPSNLDVKTSATINWWRTPKGKQSINVSLPGFAPQNFEYIVSEYAIVGSTAAKSANPKTLNSETFIFPGQAHDYYPYDGIHAYTVTWSPTRVAFYINAPNDGTDVYNAKPVAEFKLQDYPSMTECGPQAPQGNNS